MVRYDRNKLLQLYEQAKAEKFAIPSFNYYGLWDMMAIVEAAEEMHAPVLLMSDPQVYETIGPEMCVHMVDVLASQASVPVIHHIDHSVNCIACKHAIDLGFKSIMMDASDKPIEQNVAFVKEIADYAHERGCFVEAEIGPTLTGSTYEASYVGDNYLFDLQEAVRLVEEGSPDSLAIGIGNVHGFYIGKTELNFQRLAEAKEAIQIPLVLHGGTGISGEDILKAIKGGICKINVDTAINCAYMNGIRRQLIGGGENQFTLDVIRYGMDKVKVVVRQWIYMCRADNRI
ncbi:class II fructose-bisphosphate aldolase [Caproicibacter sp. BJN0012]|uniref:class II fructose-bisphosphate aldolase n=1 Tax=Caproicibacter sp. BJN0012 TaxID=3110227 RepID=UPI002E0D56D7